MSLLATVTFCGCIDEYSKYINDVSNVVYRCIIYGGGKYDRIYLGIIHIYI